MRAKFGCNFLRPAPQAGLSWAHGHITKVIIELKLWPAAGCEAKIAAEISSRPLVTIQWQFHLRALEFTISKTYVFQTWQSVLAYIAFIGIFYLTFFIWRYYQAFRMKTQQCVIWQWTVLVWRHFSADHLPVSNFCFLCRYEHLFLFVYLCAISSCTIFF